MIEKAPVGVDQIISSISFKKLFEFTNKVSRTKIVRIRDVQDFRRERESILVLVMARGPSRMLAMVRCFLRKDLEP
jgi:hypothetical protein